MISENDKQKYYKAFLKNDKKYQGIFFIGIKTTGIFCHSVCPSKKPKYKNCEFFIKSKDALLAGYRPCKRCKPLSNPNMVSSEVQLLIDEVENNPEKKWKDTDFRKLSISTSTIRRQFKKKFGMTFVEYARSRRLGIALKSIKNGSRIIDAQLDAGFDSDSGLRDAFKNTLGVSLSKDKVIKELYSQWIDTKIGAMIAIGDEDYLYLLEFVDRRGLEKEIEIMKKKFKAVIIPKLTKPIKSTKMELDKYFEDGKYQFNTPIKYFGSSFCVSVWEQLKTIPTGKAISYTELALMIKNERAIRAVARANGMNQLAIIIPCHRVIGKDGSLGGYSGGLERKRWLLNHEGVKI